MLNKEFGPYGVALGVQIGSYCSNKQSHLVLHFLSILNWLSLSKSMYPWASLRWRPTSSIKDKFVPSAYATFDRSREHSFDVILEVTGQFVGLMCSEFPAHI